MARQADALDDGQVSSGCECCGGGDELSGGLLSLCEQDKAAV